jgi:hypothetical protein
MPQALPLCAVLAPALSHRFQNRARTRPRIFTERAFDIGRQSPPFTKVSLTDVGEAKRHGRRVALSGDGAEYARQRAFG